MSRSGANPRLEGPGLSKALTDEIRAFPQQQCGCSLNEGASARYCTVPFDVQIIPIVALARGIAKVVQFLGSIPGGQGMQGIAEIVPVSDQASVSQKSLAPQVEKALFDILKSAPFRGSKQSQHLLQYIVYKSLEEHPELLKERIIGAEVFGRAIDYDTNVDPIVRARASEVRKRLAQYYVGEGKQSSIRIGFSPGSYHATFSEISRSQLDEPISPEGAPQQIENRTPEAIEPETAAVGPKAGHAVRFHPRALFPISIVALAVIAGGITQYRRQPADPVRNFWSPLLGDPKPAMIYTGANPVYMPSEHLIERFKASHHLNELETSGHEFLIPLAENPKLEPGDLLEMKDQFVTLGDVSANVRVSSLLTHFDHPFDLRSGGDVAFGDLRDSPVILIGAFNNTWTLKMTGDLPFVFGSGLTIREVSGTGRQWSPAFDSEGKVKMDYALVVRLPHSKAGGSLITIAGITQSGTRAAAELITSTAGIKLLARSLPEGWNSKDLEFVLETKVVNDIPTDPRIIAYRSW
jgi:hypothetical protein